MARQFASLICFLGLILAVCAPVQANPPAGDSEAAIAQTLKDMEQAWIDAEKNRDPAAFGKLVADDWTVINPDGKTQTKADVMEEIKTTQVVSAKLGDMKVRIFGDAAVVTGTDDVVTMKDGKESTGHYVWTDVFVKRKGKWLIVASQTAQIK